MPSQPPRRIGITANLNKEPAVTLMRKLVADLQRANFDVLLDEPLRTVVAPDEFSFGDLHKADLIAAVGGDGTILKCAREFAGSGVPVLGVKAGRLGFLTEGRTDEVAGWLRTGKFRVQERMRIGATVIDETTRQETPSALNEIVIHSAGFSRMAHLEILVDDKFLHEYFADGVIIATPTGSTAYSLSAGGPLLEPTVNAIILTPLSPHTMNVRPMVLKAEQQVRVRVHSEQTSIAVTIDGQGGVELIQDQYVDVYRYQHNTMLVVPEDYDFFSLLREKL